MNDFIDLPHLPECLLGLPLETIHEIHSHTYHAIKADRQRRGEPGNGCECNQGQSCQVCDPVLEPVKVPSDAAPKFGEEQ